MDKGFQPMKYRVLPNTIRSPSPKGTRKSNCSGRKWGVPPSAKYCNLTRRLDSSFFFQKNKIKIKTSKATLSGLNTTRPLHIWNTSLNLPYGWIQLQCQFCTGFVSVFPSPILVDPRTTDTAGKHRLLTWKRTPDWQNKSWALRNRHNHKKNQVNFINDLHHRTTYFTQISKTRYLLRRKATVRNIYKEIIFCSTDLEVQEDPID